LLPTFINVFDWKLVEPEATLKLEILSLKTNPLEVNPLIVPPTYPSDATQVMFTEVIE
jgi:hypothetical protein